jgi:hypothetical protein
LSPWQFRSCHFKNVCYNGNPEGIFSYFAHPLDDVVEADLSTGTMVPYANDARVNIDEYKFMVEKNAIRQHEVVWAHGKHDDEVVTIPANYFIPSVWTHLLMDNLYPMFRLLELFDMARATVEPMWLSDPCRTGYRDGCQFSDTRFNHNWIDLLTNGRFSLSRLQDKYGAVAKSSSRRLVCFGNVMTGLSLFTDHGFGNSGHGRNLEQPDWPVWGTGSHLWRFRLRTMHGAGIQDPESLHPFGKGSRDVVFLRKGTKTWSSNALDTQPAVNALQKALEEHNMTHIIVDNDLFLERYSLMEQMEIMARTKVVVTQVGSTAYGAFWLGKGASLVLIERGELLDYYFWSNLPYIHTKYVSWQQSAMKPLVDAVLAGLNRFQVNNKV